MKTGPALVAAAVAVEADVFGLAVVLSSFGEVIATVVVAALPPDSCLVVEVFFDVVVVVFVVFDDFFDVVVVVFAVFEVGFFVAGTAACADTNKRQPAAAIAAKEVRSREDRYGVMLLPYRKR